MSLDELASTPARLERSCFRCAPLITAQTKTPAVAGGGGEFAGLLRSELRSIMQETYFGVAYKMGHTGVQPIFGVICCALWLKPAILCEHLQLS